MKKYFSPADIRALLGISRSAIRYYIDKELISANKNAENGYSYYSWCDIEEMLDVTFFRNCMNAKADDIWDITHTQSPKAYQEVYSKQIQQFEENIHRQQNLLEILQEFDTKIQRAINYQNIVEEISVDESFYVYYPEMDKCPNIRTSLFSTSYWGSEYIMDDGDVNYKGFVMMTDEKHLEYLREGTSGVFMKKISQGQFLYTALCSKTGLDDPSLVEPLVNYIKEHNIEVTSPIYLFYLLSFRENNERRHCYEAFLPLHR